MKIFYTIFFVIILLSISNAQWVKTNCQAAGVHAITIMGNDIYVGAYNGVFLSTDKGSSWSEINNGLSYLNISSIAIKDSNIFLGLNGGSGVYQYSMKVNKWDLVGLSNSDVRSLLFYNNILIAGCDEGVYLSTDYGSTWNLKLDLNGGSLGNCEALASIGTHIFAGINGDNDMYVSKDNGENWTLSDSGLSNTRIWSLTANDSLLFTGSNGGVFYSSNFGNLWQNIGFPNIQIVSLLALNDKLFVGSNNGLFLSTDLGKSWSEIDSGLFNYVRAIAADSSDIFVGSGGGVWKRPLSEMITGINETKNNLPIIFSLAQNYPNPFNPTTIINYSLLKASFITVKVYDMLGRKVATLVNEEKKAGNYSVNFNAGSLASGIYFYRMQAGQFVDTKKLILLK